MKSPRVLLIVTFALVVAALACNAPGGETPTEQVAEASASPTVQVPQVGPSPTTQSQPPSNAPTQTPGAATTGPTATTACGYNGVFQADVTIPDDTPIVTGQAFTKTWRVKNNGCQKWPAGTTLVYIDGAQMGGPASVTVPETAAGGVQDISVNLTAPNAAGDYRGNWRLKTPDGVLFGDTIYVKIKAVAPTPTSTNVPAAPTATLGVIIIPGPLIVVDYTANYVGGVWTCASGPLTLYNYTAIVKNTGTATLESAYTEVQQPVGTKKNGGTSNSPFQSSPTNANCNDPSMQVNSLAVNATGWVGAFTANAGLTGGTPARLILKLCSAESAGGVCKTVNLDFTP